MTDISKITNEQVRWERMEQRRLNNTYPIDPDDIIPDLEWKDLKAIGVSECVNDLVDILIDYQRNTVIGSVGNHKFWSEPDQFTNLVEAKAWANEQYKKKIAEVLGL